ncbi:hypothetical protein NBRC116590_19560 [Pelagimonas sp. KU-00592-HH]|uniref:zinc-ribbon domain-containing protein n=1 Tax=Pelagimonas sp. KU-00592-HH TaxID=3127651 RepID=UPI00310350D0
MRLSCPNCGAQYEVPTEVIPESGRDVQCSNCGHTWFQMHPDQDVEMAAELGTSTPDESWAEDAPAPEPTPEVAAAPEPAPEPEVQEPEVQPPDFTFDTEPTPDPEPEAEPAEAELSEDTVSAIADMIADAAARHAEEAPAEEESAFEPVPDPEDIPEAEDTSKAPVQRRERRKIDPNVADILRQEAEHEASARAEESLADLESQPDLGLDDKDDMAAGARARMRRIRGLPEEAEPQENVAEAEEHHSRRELLPDIEEINSTLRSADERGIGETAAAAAPSRRRRNSGFRLGFGFTMLIAAMIILAYVYNREIVAAWPAGEPYVMIFMDKVNAARLWLDTMVTEGMLWLDEKAASAGGEVN